jgi:hypothetical protein
MMNFLASYWPLLSILAIFLFMRRSGRGCGMHRSGHRHGTEHDDTVTRESEPASSSGGPNDTLATKASADDVNDDRLRHRL